MPFRSGTGHGSVKLEPPKPGRVDNVVAKPLTSYIVRWEQMEAFLKQRFSAYENYNFDLKVRIYSLAKLNTRLILK